jgi:hypothetical protein
MLLTSTFLRLTGNVFAWEAALHKYMDRDMARKGMLLTKDEGLKMADIIFRSQAPGGDGTRVRRVREDPRHRVGTDARPRVGDWEAHPSSGSMGIGEDPRHPRNL